MAASCDVRLGLAKRLQLFRTLFVPELKVNRASGHYSVGTGDVELSSLVMSVLSWANALRSLQGQSS